MALSDHDRTGDEALARVREEFSLALIESHRRRSSIGAVEAAAARFCRVLRERGETPEQTLIEAKRVIERAIDGDDVVVAERAVSSCIQHYFRD